MLKRAMLLITAGASIAAAQSADTVTTSPGYWKRFGLGFGASILLHEAAHITTSFAVGAHPSFGVDTFRPTVYSGISIYEHPREQFLFSAAGLTIQSVLDEAILDIPHNRGGAFERGLLGGGIGTTLFYLTLGRTGTVSDVDYMARTHVLNKTEITLIYGSIAALHSWRISRNSAYANFFARPTSYGLDVGVSIR